MINVPVGVGVVSPWAGKNGRRERQVVLQIQRDRDGDHDREGDHLGTAGVLRAEGAEGESLRVSVVAPAETGGSEAKITNCVELVAMESGYLKKLFFGRVLTLHVETRTKKN